MFFDTTATGITREALQTRVRMLGVMFSGNGKFRGRACTHLDVTAGQIEEGVAAIRAAVCA